MTYADDDKLLGRKKQDNDSSSKKCLPKQKCKREAIGCFQDLFRIFPVFERQGVK